MTARRGAPGTVAGMPRELPPTDALTELAAESMHNAVRYLDAADVLLVGTAQHAAPALTLSTSALEEFGKAMLCLSAVTGQVTAAEFWAAFTDHTGKLLHARVWTMMLMGDATIDEQLAGDIRSTVDREHDRRMRSQYVDYRNTRVISPAATTVSATRRFAAEVRREVEGVARVLPPAQLPQIVQQLSDAAPVLDRLNSMLDDAVDGSDAGTVLMEMRRQWVQPAYRPQDAADDAS